MRDVDHRALFGGNFSVAPGGTVTMAAAEPLVCFRDLRVSMSAMTPSISFATPPSAS